MPATPGVTTPSMRRAPTTTDPSCGRRSPKRARASPSPQDRPMSRSNSSNGRANSSLALTAAGPSSSRPSTAEHRRHRIAKLSASASQSSSASTEWDDAIAPPPRHAATSPCRSPTHKAHQWGSTRGARRREMSVPLLSQTLSHVSLSQSTPPYATELSPDAMTRAAASSSPPLMDTPATVVADTPRRLPRLRRLNTPAPLATRDLGYPNTAPMPVIHSLLGSPFDSKAKLYPLELQSPTWLAKPPPKEEIPVWHAEWMEEKDVLPQLQESGYVPAPRGSYTTTEDSGSCTSATSSFFSSERHAPRPTSSRPSVVGIWDHDNTFYDDDVVPTPNRQLFGKSRVNDNIALSTRLLQSSPGQTSPLMGKRVLPSPTGSSHNPSPRPLALSRIASAASSTQALENEPLHSPTQIGSVPASTRNRGRTSTEPFDDSHLSIPADSLLLHRRTSDPVQSSGDAFAVFLARCGGDRATKSEIASHDRSSPPPPDASSEPNDLELSPLRSVTQRIPGLPTRSGSAPLPHQLAVKTRIERLKHFPEVDEPSPKSTPKRTAKTGPAPRPLMRRGVTVPQIPQVPSIPSFGTPISQLFGDDKPSPAAFASTGLVKKRGGRTSFPQFHDGNKNTARSWTPAPVATSGRCKEHSTERKHTVSGGFTASLRQGVLRDDDKREVLSHELELEDTDEDDVSPIRPMRSSFRRSFGGHHRRMSSTASDIMTSPASRRNRGHARMSSTASSIGGTRGLRRKGSSMFNSGASMTSDSEKQSPATPTKALPFSSVQPKFGLTTPSPTVATTQYPFAAHRSSASLDATISPTTTPMLTGRVRTLSRGGPVPRASNPMLAATFRAHGGLAPATPALESTIAESYMSDEARVAGAGRFERDFALVQALGNGEFSQVWKVRSKADGTIWAVKTGRPYTGFKNRLRQLEEVSILRELDTEHHPHIVRFVDSWEQAGRLYIRTEMAECGDLSRYLLSLGDIGGLDEGRVWKMLVELTSALDHIHSRGVLHLDFKPSNVLITKEGSLKVADFGLSVFAEDEGNRSRRFEEVDDKNDEADDNNTKNDDNDDFYDTDESERGLGVGLAPSPIMDRDFEGDRDYLCPEALRDAPPAPSTDMFSLGIMTLEAALNVVLPSNGDAWVKLRNDDFSDLEDHYAIRGEPSETSAFSFAGEPPAPVVSATLLSTIKGMMNADPAERMTLAEVLALPPLLRARAAMLAADEGEGSEFVRRAAGPALADEEEGWIEYVLGEGVGVGGE